MSSQRRYIKLFEQHLTEVDIHNICKKYNITDYTINDDMSIDVNGSVSLSNQKLTKIPLTFNKVSGGFYCTSNLLKSLKGCPKEVVGDFNCSNNQLMSLEDCPDIVSGNFYCAHNQLSSFKGVPKYIGGRFIYYNNQPLSLPFSVSELGEVAITTLLNNQEEYGILYSDGTFNIGRLSIFLKDFKAGILDT